MTARAPPLRQRKSPKSIRSSRTAQYEARYKRDGKAAHSRQRDPRYTHYPPRFVEAYGDRLLVVNSGAGETVGNLISLFNRR